MIGLEQYWARRHMPNTGRRCSYHGVVFALMAIVAAAGVPAGSGPATCVAPGWSGHRRDLMTSCKVHDRQVWRYVARSSHVRY
jgi:hypothetical protein